MDKTHNEDNNHEAAAAAAADLDHNYIDTITLKNVLG